MPGIARSVGGKPQKIEIRGHTSAKPVTGAFQDKWDLAYARSRRVMEALVAAGVAPHRCRLAVAAANEPSQVLEDASLLQANSREARPAAGRVRFAGHLAPAGCCRGATRCLSAARTNLDLTPALGLASAPSPPRPTRSGGRPLCRFFPPRRPCQEKL